MSDSDLGMFGLRIGVISVFPNFDQFPHLRVSVCVCRAGWVGGGIYIKCLHACMRVRVPGDMG